MIVPMMQSVLRRCGGVRRGECVQLAAVMYRTHTTTTTPRPLVMSHYSTLTNTPPDGDVWDSVYDREVPRTMEEMGVLLGRPVDSPGDSRVLKVAVVGVPNSGKSTLINSLMNWKVVSVSSKVHTTQVNARAVFNHINTQLVFLDTPGLVSPEEITKHKLKRSLLREAELSLQEADLMAVIHDISNHFTRNYLNPRVLRLLALYPDIPAVLLLNKVDKTKSKQNLLDITRNLTEGIVGGSVSHTQVGREDVLFRTDLENVKEKLIKKTLALEKKSKAQSDNANTNDNTGNNAVRDCRDVNAKANLYTMENSRLGNTNDTDCIVNNTPVDEHRLDNKGFIDGKVKNSDTEMFRIQIKNCNVHSDYQEGYAKENESNTYCNTSRLRETVTKGEREPLDNITGNNKTQEKNIMLNMEVQEEIARGKNASPMSEPAVKAYIEDRKSWPGFQEVFMISALDGTGVDHLRDFLISASKPGPWIFSSQVVTDQNPEELVLMTVREKFLDTFPNELPYNLHFSIEYWDLSQSEVLNLVVRVGCRQRRVTKVVVGSGGGAVSRVAKQAEQELRNTFRTEVRLRINIVYDPALKNKK